MHKIHLKSFVLEILFIRDYNSTFYLFDGNVWSVFEVYIVCLKFIVQRF